MGEEVADGDARGRHRLDAVGKGRMLIRKGLATVWHRLVGKGRSATETGTSPGRGRLDPLRHEAGIEKPPPAAMDDGAALPRVVWMLWLQGWERAPELVRACAETWRRQNPGWTVRLLDRGRLGDFLPADALAHVAGKPLEPEAFSDVIRLELLARYGGVWVDATVYCMRPLDTWLPERITAGFFAFARPAADRMLSSWFLAAAPGSDIVHRWQEAARRYWENRESRDHYFWVHRLFAACHASDPRFRASWDAVPTLSAVEPHRFQPYETRLAAPPTAADEALLSAADVPVLKLTHKRPPPEAPPRSLARRLCDRARVAGPGGDRAAQRPEVLVTWYGSFAGHGTIGDLLSLESVVGRLVAEGWRVAHASAADIDMPSAIRVDHEQVDPGRFAAVVFTCGPVIAGHPQTEALFARFRGRPMLGVGVSLLAPDHERHADPFTAVLARQGAAERHEDVAIVAPLPMMPPANRAGTGPVIGLALRGPQAEYGEANCLWERTEELARAAAEHLLRRGGGRLEIIENHLGRSELTAREIEARYAACDLVVTSRFHGGMLALRHGVPFVAIDQIRGGAKVFPLLAGGGWPHVLRADAADEAAVVRAAAAALAVESRPLLAAARDRAVRGANVTLRAMTSWLAERSARAR
jgi:hypothetical protein